MIASPRQEAHLVSSLQDLFKDQEKRITTAVLVAWYARIVCLLYHWPSISSEAGLNDGPKVQLATVGMLTASVNDVPVDVAHHSESLPEDETWLAWHWLC